MTFEEALASVPANTPARIWRHRRHGRYIVKRQQEPPPRHPDWTRYAEVHADGEVVYVDPGDAPTPPPTAPPSRIAFPAVFPNPLDAKLSEIQQDVRVVRTRVE